MNSVLKILVDVDCQVYCDYELKGDAFSNSIFGIEMRKGNYILEFKKNDTILLTQEYEMKSNNEEPLLRVSLINAYDAIAQEESFAKIASLNVEVKRDYEKNIYDVWLENIDTGEKTPLVYNVPETSRFDKCGLLCINEGGKSIGIPLCSPGWDNLLGYEGGKWGCINKLGEIKIPIIYDKPIEFKNPKVTVAKLNGENLFINKWGKTVFSNLFDKIIDNDPFCDNHCIISLGDKFGIIDSHGKYFLPTSYDEIKRTNYYIEDERGNSIGVNCYIIKKGDYYGLINKEGKTLLPTEFDKIQKTRFSFIKAIKKTRFGIFTADEKGIIEIHKRLGKVDSFHKEGNLLYSDHYENIELGSYRVVTIKDGYSIIMDYDGNILLDKGYKMVPAYYGPCFYDTNTRNHYHAQIVVSHGKFGCLNKSILLYLGDYSYKDDVSKIQEIVPCEYDYVAEFGNGSPLYSVDKWDNWISTDDEWKEIYYFVKKTPSGDLHYYQCNGYEKNDNVIIKRDSIRPHPDSYYLFLDTETTGLLPTKQFDNHKDYLKEAPHIVQIALLFFDKNFKKISERNILISPKGYIIPQESTKIHGITNSYALEHGEDWNLVMDYLKAVFDTVNVIIGHNLDFDLEVLDAEFWRRGVTWGYVKDDGSDTFYKAEEIIDTMKLGAEICKIPSTIKGEKYKWPTLDELYRTLFGTTYKGQHNALNDVKATYECYCQMIRNKK